jgi:uncharacterized membrane protein
MTSINKKIPEKEYHLFFRVGLFIKTLITAGEIILGVVFYVVSADTLRGIFYSILGGEASEQPRDFIWGYVIKGFEGLVGVNQSFWAFIFLFHGIAKIFFVWALYKNKLWAYPGSAAVFGLFALYQIYTMIYLPSLLLALITVFDIILIGLIMHEYRHHKRQLAG